MLTVSSVIDLSKGIALSHNSHHAQKALKACAALVLGTLTIVAPFSSTSWAAGALATGLPDDIVRHGATFGFVLNSASQAEARARAIDLCRTSAPTAEARARCTIAWSGEHMCVAVAMNARTGATGLGWHLEATVEAAERGALSNCRQMSTPERKSYCAIQKSGCDTHN